MNTLVFQKCDLLIRNRDILQKAFKFENDMMMLAGSSFYVGMNLTASEEKLKYCAQILKEHTKALSEFRGNVKMPLLCKMATAESPKDYLISIQQIVDQMKHIKWTNAQYKILAAMTILDHGDMEAVPVIIEKMTDLFQGMKEKHPWLTSSEDLPFAAMLSVSEFDLEHLMEEMEACYDILKKDYSDSNAVQSLSHILALDSMDTFEKCARIQSITKLLKDKKHKYGTGHEMAVLGTMSILEIPVEQIVEEIIEADEYLKKQKGFGDFVMGDKRRRMYAALMVMDAHVPPASNSHQAVLDSTLVLVIAMEICMLIIMTTVIC